ncbi:MAG TPA: TolC family protein [Bacteroidales bacterium]|nr:TolC family protein [Bacteroidales bacterium]
MKQSLIILLFLFLYIQPGNALPANDTDTLSLSLSNVVDLAIQQSASVKYAQNTNVNYYWRWKNFKTSFRPQLTLNGDLPNYTHTTSPVVQPDGSIEFKQVSQAQASAQLSLSQSIPQTGTSIYAATNMYRIQDFIKNSVEFSGSPFQIGLYQPVFAFNYMKWSKKTEPLVYEEAQKGFVESVEQIALEATKKFFRYLQIQTSYNLAESNKKNSEDNLRIAEIKRKLGKISENDFSRIQLSVLNAQKALNKARMDLKNTGFELKSYINLDQDKAIELSVPLDMILFNINMEKALQEANLNRKETPLFERRLIEADRDLIRAKRSTGLSATLVGSYGVSNSADFYGGIYENPEKQRTARLSMSIPILDWGRSTSTVKLAESRRDLVLYDVEKDKSDFEREVIVQVEQFGLLRDQLNTAREADKVAENGYQIATKKFQSGEISITDLNISLAERESAKRDYITSIENYWQSYYRLRILTLYDFELNQRISYENPMLTGK